MYIIHLILFKCILFVLTIRKGTYFIQSLFRFDQYRIYLTFFQIQIFKTLHKAIKINKLCISGSKETSREFKKKNQWRRERKKGAHDEDEVSFDAGIV